MENIKPITILLLDITKSRNLMADEAIFDNCLNISIKNKKIFTQRNCALEKNREEKIKE